MNRILLIALVLALSCVTSVNGNQKKYARLALCFNTTDYPSVDEIKTCLRNASTCFDDAALVSAQTCIEDGVAEALANSTDSGTRFLASHGGNSGGGMGGFKNRSALGSSGERGGFGGGGFRPKGKDKLGALAGIVRGCLETQADCIKEEIRSFIKNKLPECVNTTATALGECYKTNAATCATSCADAVPSDNPFSGVASANIRSCSGFQNRIMDPSCDIIDCCSDCQTQYDALMTCVGQDLLKLKPEPCDLSCSADNTTRRELSVTPLRKEYAMRKLAGHIELEPEATVIAEECATYLDTEEETLTSDAVTDLIVNGEFIGCVADVATLVAEEQKEFDAAHTEDGTSSASISGMAITGVVAAFLGLVGLM